MSDDSLFDIGAQIIKETLQALREEDFQFGVEAFGTAWDVYYFTKNETRGTVAFRIINDELEIGVFRAGELDGEAVLKELIENAPN